MLCGVLSIVIGHCLAKTSSTLHKVSSGIDVDQAAIIGVLGGVVLMPVVLVWFLLMANLFEQLSASEAEAKNRFLRSLFTGVDIRPNKDPFVAAEEQSSTQAEIKKGPNKLRKPKPEKPTVEKNAGYLSFCPFGIIQAPFNIGFGAAAGALGSAMSRSGNPGKAAILGCVGGKSTSSDFQLKADLSTGVIIFAFFLLVITIISCTAYFRDVPLPLTETYGKSDLDLENGAAKSLPSIPEESEEQLHSIERITDRDSKQSLPGYEVDVPDVKDDTKAWQ